MSKKQPIPEPRSPMVTSNNLEGHIAGSANLRGRSTEPKSEATSGNENALFSSLYNDVRPQIELNRQNPSVSCGETGLLALRLCKNDLNAVEAYATPTTQLRHTPLRSGNPWTFARTSRTLSDHQPNQHEHVYCLGCE